MVAKDSITLVTKIGFFRDLGVKVAQVVLRKTSILEEASHLIINIFSELGLVTVLQPKFASEHALELLTLLDVHQALPTHITHTRLGRTSSATCV